MSKQDLVVELQLALAQSGTVPDHQLRDLAQRYARACVEANSRLANCVFYLRRGFRCEAIRLCELAPNLLDLVNSLNFPERPTWLGLAEQLQVHTPDLSFNLAVEVNEAYEIDEQHLKLIDEFRLLNTMQRPHPEREAALNALRQAQPYNRIWEENVARLNSS